MYNTKRAFTLAEVLIALGIIGVVAALTLPAVIQEYQKQVVVNKLKKGYNIFQNATQQAYYEHGDFSNWDTLPDINSPTNAEKREIYNNFVKKYYGNYIFITENNLREGIKAVGNVGATYVNLYTPWYYLKDGSCFMVRNSLGSHQYFSIIYDINGNKGPNRYGRDIFMFAAYLPTYNGGKEGVLQFGGLMTSMDYRRQMNNSNLFLNLEADCNKNNTGYLGGLSCGGWIEDNNWKIPDDYPW